MEAPGCLQTKSGRAAAAPPWPPREGGYVEQIQTQNVAWTPRNFYLLSFPEKIVGFAVPSDRQALSIWLQNTLVKPRTFPPSWADRAIFRADAGAPIVLAVNLAQSVSPKGVERWLKTVESPDVKKNEINFGLMGASLAGVKSALLEIDVTETIRGTIQIDFDNSLAFVKPIARDVVMAILEEYGANVDDLRRWSFDVRNNTITMSGALTEQSARRALSFLSAPRLTGQFGSVTDAAPTPANAPVPNPNVPAPEPTPQDGLKATQRYFASVLDVIQELKTQNPQSTRTSRVWFGRSAKEIEELPLLNVDNDLLDWGAARSYDLQGAIGFKGNQLRRQGQDLPRHRRHAQPGFYGGAGYSGNGKAYDAEVINKQSNAILSVQVDAQWQALETSIAKMRRQLVQKYKVEF